MTNTILSSIEIAAGAGGQALGLEQAGFKHLALVEIDKHAVCTLRQNRPWWNVIHGDVREFDGRPYRGADLLAGGVPCPPFSVAGKQLGEKDERDLFPEVLRLTSEIEPRAIMVENVRGLLDKKFAPYRARLSGEIEGMGYKVFWNLLNAADFGVAQNRPRTILVALRPEFAPYFSWPEKYPGPPPSVGAVLYKEMASRGWEGAKVWSKLASGPAPTIVGGSKKHGGPDLGPTRAKRAWAAYGVDGRKIAEDPPEPGFSGMPNLTVRMAAILQGFPNDWEFCGRKTPAYRQVGNAFPPPVARAVGESIARALRKEAVEAPPERRQGIPVEAPLFASD